MADGLLASQYCIGHRHYIGILLHARGEITIAVIVLHLLTDLTKTTYHRPQPVIKDDTSVIDSDEKGEKSSSVAVDAASIEHQNFGSPPKWTSQLKIYNGTFSKENFFKIFLRPLPFLLSPVVRPKSFHVFTVR